MANLQRIQERIDMIPSLIQEVESLRPVSAVGGPAIVEPSFAVEDIQNINDILNHWEAITAEIVAQEVGDTDPFLYDFGSHWRAPFRNYSYKDGLKQKLKRAHTDLRILLDVAKERERVAPTIPKNDIWALIHPDLEEQAKKRIDNGLYADAVEFACKELNAKVREIVKAKTGEELDGAKLMQRAFSVDNPVIFLTKGKGQSDQDTQKGYMQIFAGVMTGIRNPKAHDNEVISREDALRKLILISMLMYKVDNRI